MYFVIYQEVCNRLFSFIFVKLYQTLICVCELGYRLQTLPVCIDHGLTPFSHYVLLQNFLIGRENVSPIPSSPEQKRENKRENLKCLPHTSPTVFSRHLKKVHEKCRKLEHLCNKTYSWWVGSPFFFLLFCFLSFTSFPSTCSSYTSSSSFTAAALLLLSICFNM